MTGHAGTAAASVRRNYAALGASAVTVLKHRYYTGLGTWNMCVPAVCNQRNYDWGADSLTYALYFHWQLTRDPKVARVMTALTRTAHRYGPADGQWSDVPEWDSIADVREYQVTGNPAALVNAQAAFAIVDSLDSARFAAGRCPAIDYQRPNGGTRKLKTLETDSNYIKAALLLYQVTGDLTYLTKAQRKYAAVRKYFLGKRVPLYTAYVYDSGKRCVAQRGQYFASVNGNMIWAGAQLARLTKRPGYLAQATATATAVSHYLCDGDRIFADPQVENDVVEPLVEAMYLLATADHLRLARHWLLVAASAAAAGRTANGTYGRIFDGPPPVAPVTAWQANGGIALMIAAASLDPRGKPADPAYWRAAVFVPDNASLPADRNGTVRIAFTGRAIAIIGTLGTQGRKPGHARVFIDSLLSFNRLGIWQGKFAAGPTLPSSVLFAWRWRRAARHALTIAPSVSSLNRGATYFHMIGYYVEP
ncbi:MAG TPA: hypothetical protein VNF47_04410 [Streptosporangiaceae bacterium]|nr:hypothetical protein [Streptosporangiaceae bacterium]